MNSYIPVKCNGERVNSFSALSSCPTWLSTTHIYFILNNYLFYFLALDDFETNKSAREWDNLW
jgi:hypothetical protein